MTISAELVAQVVREVVREVTAGPSGLATPVKEICDGVFPDMNAAIEAADQAAREYLGRSMRDRAKYVAAIREAACRQDNLEYMAKAAVEETGMGNVPDKIAKNRFAALLTPGTEDIVTEAWSGDDGLTTIETSPFGVIGAITPTTNPSETIINNAIGMLAAGNAVVFSPHPRAKRLSLWLVRELNAALAAVGAPKNLIVTVTEPSEANTKVMMEHKLIRMLVATGGTAIVRAVMSTGKKAIGAGAGNPPVVVDQTADLKKAARCIVDGATFDNNLPCTAEKEVIAVDSIADLLRFHMVNEGAYELRDRALVDKLQALVMDGKRPKTEWVGKDAAVILAGLGIKPPPGTRLIIMETEFEHRFVQSELMMPILPVVRAKDVDEAIELAYRAEHGFRHTAIIHSLDVNALTRMGRKMQTTIFVKNGPSYAGIGIGGEGYITFTIAGPTGEGLTSARSFCRRRRCVLAGGLNVR
ncbi:MAG: aldehyde dehydrogenase EutE [Propionibacteriaceae bacterium]|jgi:propionaldehyde dehydrogenase|nr:aldehyde dehydrogenase EutE [Propionibacteriaceae bacterium]